MIITRTAKLAGFLAILFSSNIYADPEMVMSKGATGQIDHIEIEHWKILDSEISSQKTHISTEAFVSSTLPAEGIEENKTGKIISTHKVCFMNTGYKSSFAKFSMSISGFGVEGKIHDSLFVRQRHGICITIYPSIDIKVKKYGAYKTYGVTHAEMNNEISEKKGGGIFYVNESTAFQMAQQMDSLQHR